MVQEKVKSDADVFIKLQGQAVQNNGRRENAERCPGREATVSNPITRNRQFKGNLAYMALLQESVPDAWPAGRIYRVNVYGDGSLISTLYFQNAKVDDAAVEGVNLRVDLGIQSLISAPKTYSTIVTRMFTC